MRRLLFALALIATPAFAQTPPAKPAAKPEDVVVGWTIVEASRDVGRAYQIASVKRQGDIVSFFELRRLPAPMDSGPAKGGIGTLRGVKVDCARRQYQVQGGGWFDANLKMMPQKSPIGLWWGFDGGDGLLTALCAGQTPGEPLVYRTIAQQLAAFQPRMQAAPPPKPVVLSPRQKLAMLCLRRARLLEQGGDMILYQTKAGDPRRARVQADMTVLTQMQVTLESMVPFPLEGPAGARLERAKEAAMLGDDATTTADYDQDFDNNGPMIALVRKCDAELKLGMLSTSFGAWAK